MSDKQRTFSYYFIFILIPALVISLVLLGIVFYARYTATKESLIVNRVKKLELIHNEIEFTLENIISDLIILSGMDIFKVLMNSNSFESAGDVEQIFKLFCSERGIYDQVRFLDETGMEIIRVNFNNEEAVIVPKEELQFKGNRYYFLDTFVMDRENVFFSPLDLNIEGGEVEKPENPMIRVGMPVFDNDGNKKGIILLNYFGKNIIDIVSGYTKASDDSFFLLNADSYWLYSRYPEKSWSFMYKDRQDIKFGNENPDIWNDMLNRNTGILKDSDNTYIFVTVSPMHDPMKTSTGSSDASGKSSALDPDDYFWKIVSDLPDTVFYTLTRKIITGMMILIFIVITIALILSIILAKLWYIQNLSEQQVRKSLEEKELLLREIHHRVKNSLALVSSFVVLYRVENSGHSNDEFFDALKQKIDTISLVHTYLYQSSDIENINFKSYLKDLIESMLNNLVVSAGNVTLDFEVEDIFMTEKPTISIGLIISELVINSLKHAFPNDKAGKIAVKGTKEGTDYVIIYSDNGIGFPEGFTIKDSDSFGMIIIESLIGQLEGNLSNTTGHNSTITISFPVTG